VKDSHATDATDPTKCVPDDACGTSDACKADEKCSDATSTCYPAANKDNNECVALKADGMTLSAGGECLNDCK
jgi:hypothetical protein